MSNIGRRFQERRQRFDDAGDGLKVHEPMPAESGDREALPGPEAQQKKVERRIQLLEFQLKKEKDLLQSLKRQETDITLIPPAADDPSQGTWSSGQEREKKSDRPDSQPSTKKSFWHRIISR